jgi:hypothetical protein
MDEMEGCPDEHLNLFYLVLSAFVGVFVFLVAKGFEACQKGAEKSKDKDKKKESMGMEETKQLQIELYGLKTLKRLSHITEDIGATQAEMEESPSEDDPATEHPPRDDDDSSEKIIQA